MKTSRIRFYSNKEYPDEDKLMQTIFNNTKGDHPVKVEKLKDSYAYKVTYEYD